MQCTQSNFITPRSDLCVLSFADSVQSKTGGKEVSVQPGADPGTHSLILLLKERHQKQLQILKKLNYLKNSTNWEGEKMSSFHLQGKTQEEPSCPEQLLCSSPRGSFFQKCWEELLGIRGGLWWLTAPVTGRGEVRAWLPKPFPPNHQPQLLP